MTLLLSLALLTNSVVTPAFMDNIKEVESYNGRVVINDHGNSLGDYGMSRAAWTDVNKLRAKAGLVQYDYRKHVFNSGISREYSKTYAQWLELRLRKRLKRPATEEQVQRAYTKGFRGYFKR